MENVDLRCFFCAELMKKPVRRFPIKKALYYLADWAHLFQEEAHELNKIREAEGDLKNRICADESNPPWGLSICHTAENGVLVRLGYRWSEITGGLSWKTLYREYRESLGTKMGIDLDALSGT